ncbi:LytR/AlgR family response regulator transcription factor [Undibacterium sp. Xuan67W]|uniref:LytR/AlgR family response regulator transcription factor n=1 Tax=Undibacterium sp. Xuan67W TaxID=3413057 RepID=UPI003BF1B2C7
MKAMIVDDERLARAELKRLLNAHPHITLIGEASNIIEAERAIIDLTPDLVFLDVQMPGGSGFDLLSQLDRVPSIIFTTAFDIYALRAFEVNALDYLLKPIESERLSMALERVQAAASVTTTSTTSMENDKKLFIKDGERCWLVDLATVALFESEGNYTRVYFDNQRPLMLRSLNQLEQKLDTKKFIRSSRQYIVNLDFVTSMTNNNAGGLNLILKDGKNIEMSRRRAADFRQMHRF